MPQTGIVWLTIEHRLQSRPAYQMKKSKSYTLEAPDGGWGILVCIGMALPFVSTNAGNSIGQEMQSQWVSRWFLSEWKIV